MGLYLEVFKEVKMGKIFSPFALFGFTKVVTEEKTICTKYSKVNHAIHECCGHENITIILCPTLPLTTRYESMGAI